MEDANIIFGTAIDTADEGDLELSIQIINTIRDMERAFNANSTGKSIFEAERNFSHLLGRRQIWDHAHICLIGRELAASGIGETLDFFVRFYSPRLRMNLLLADELGKDILDIKSNIDPIASRLIDHSLEEVQNKAFAPKIDFNHFMKGLLNPYRDPYLPIIKRRGNGFDISGTAVFREDKLVGELNKEETKAFLRIVESIEGGFETFTLPGEDKEEPVDILIEIKHSKAAIHVITTGEQPKIKISLKETGVLSEIDASLNLNHNKVKRLEQLYASRIEQETEAMITKVQHEFQADIFDFSGAIHRQDPSYLKGIDDSWRSVFSQLDVEVSVHTHITNTGLSKK